MAFIKSELLAAPTSALGCPADLDLADDGLRGADHLDLEAVMKAVGILPNDDQPEVTSSQAAILPVLDDLELPDLWDYTPEEEVLSLPEATSAVHIAKAEPEQNYQVPAAPTTTISAPVAYQSYQAAYQASYQAAYQQAYQQAYQTPYQTYQTPYQTPYQVPLPLSSTSFPESLQYQSDAPSTSSGPLLLDMLESSNIVRLGQQCGGALTTRAASPAFSDVSSSPDSDLSASSGFYSLSSSSASVLSDLQRSPPVPAVAAPAAKRPRVTKAQGGTTKRQRGQSVEEKREDGCRGKAGKPKTSYIEMIARAMMSDPTRQMLLHDIYDHILLCYPYYKTAPSTWRNAVRHNLTVNDCFVKSGRASNGRGYFWAVHPACVEMFSKGDFRRMQARRLAQQMYKNADSAATIDNATTTSAAIPSSTYQQMTFTKVTSAFASIPSMPRYQHQQTDSQFFAM